MTRATRGWKVKSGDDEDNINLVSYVNSPLGTRLTLSETYDQNLDTWSVECANEPPCLYNPSRKRIWMSKQEMIVAALKAEAEGRRGQLYLNDGDTASQ